MPEMPEPAGPEPAEGSALARNVLRLFVLVLAVFVVQRLVDGAMNLTEALPPGHGALMRGALLASVLLLYAVLIAIPFVPGVEIGMALILMRGAEVAVLVYLATIAGLMLAYLAGCLVPERWLARLFRDLRLTRASEMMLAIGPLSPQDRLDRLATRLPRWLGARALRWRYLALAVLINLPGSSVIGGGGGICLAAGLSRLFRRRATALTIALAVLPFPLVVWLWEPGFLP